MVQWIYYPRSAEPTAMALEIVDTFRAVAGQIDSSKHKKQESQVVLSKVIKGLSKLGFQVERGKKLSQKVFVPVLFGLNGKPVKSFDADAYHPDEHFVVEVEAGRGVTNYQFLKDLFQACMMHDVFYLAIAIRNIYRSSKDFEKVNKFFDALYASNRLNLPLKGVLLIGY